MSIPLPALAGVLDRPGFDRSGDVSVLTESGFGSSDTVRDKKLGGGNYRYMSLPV